MQEHTCLTGTCILILKKIIGYNLVKELRINFCIKQKLILLNLIYSDPINSVLAFFYRKKMKSLVKYKLIKFLGRNLIHGKY